jgi:hypothetical protein
MKRVSGESNANTYTRRCLFLIYNLEIKTEKENFHIIHERERESFANVLRVENVPIIFLYPHPPPLRERETFITMNQQEYDEKVHGLSISLSPL